MNDHTSVLWLRTSLWPTFHWSLLCHEKPNLQKRLGNEFSQHTQEHQEVISEMNMQFFASLPKAMLFASYPGSSAQNQMWSFHSCLAINKIKWMPSLSGQSGHWTLPFQTVIQGQEDMFPSQDGEKFHLRNSQTQTWQVTSRPYSKSSFLYSCNSVRHSECAQYTWLPSFERMKIMPWKPLACTTHQENRLIKYLPMVMPLI